MIPQTPDFLVTSDGSHTLFHPLLNEHYHSIHGAITESAHVYIQHGLHFFKTDEIKIFEVGFGTGLNAFLTFCETEKSDLKVQYTSIEKFILPESIYTKLNYHEILGYETEWLKFHTTEWNSWQSISSKFQLKKLEADWVSYIPDTTYNLIYFDAFAPEKQTEMWTEEIFEKLYNMLQPGGILVTYSAKGIIKQGLRSAGFEVKRLPGPPGKRHMIRAIKN